MLSIRLSGLFALGLSLFVSGCGGGSSDEAAEEAEGALQAKGSPQSTVIFGNLRGKNLAPPGSAQSLWKLPPTLTLVTQCPGAEEQRSTAATKYGSPNASGLASGEANYHANLVRLPSSGRCQLTVSDGSKTGKPTQVMAYKEPTRYDFDVSPELDLESGAR